MPRAQATCPMHQALTGSLSDRRVFAHKQKAGCSGDRLGGHLNAYARPQTLNEALELAGSGQWKCLAGGTDIYPGQGRQISGSVLDLTGVPELSGIRQTDGLRLGACTTWSEIAAATLPLAARALQQAARQVGGRQIQNTGTIGGNLCNASPAADGVPPLMALDAVVELQSPRGRREVPLTQFITGPRQTLRAADEIVTAIQIPAASLSGSSSFVKLGARSYLVISIGMVAARIVTNGEEVTAAALSVGACSAVARRLPAIEADLVGKPVAGLKDRILPDQVAAALSPIDDVRATAEYRTDVVAALLRRAVEEAVG